MMIRIRVALAASLILSVLTGCATTSAGLTSSADRLERNADALARDARDDTTSGYLPNYSRDARELADQARDFRRTVADSRSDERDVAKAFEELSRDYHAVRGEVERSDSREAQADFRSVTEAYLDIEREMSKHASSDRRRYARDRDQDSRDRY